LTKDYDIDRIIVWGPDRGMLKHNFDVMDYSRSKARNLLNLFTDVSYDVSDLFGYDQPLSQHKVCQMMGIQEVGELHDAYADAQNLAQIIRGFCGKDPRKL
jgi:inhibitor of KinA sporulation pathway (predicted exonuclease)